MLKINLLPPYIWEKRKVRQAAFLFGVLFLAVLAGMVAWYVTLQNRERDLGIQVAEMEQRANEVRQLEAQLQAEKSKIPAIQAKVAFIEGVMEYNTLYPKLYEELAKYTYNRIVYTSVEPSSNQLKIAAHARSVGDCGRYLLNMYRASHIFTQVGIDSVPGWDGAGPRGFNFSVTCNLKTPISAPSYSPAGGGAAQAQAQAPVM